MNKKQFIEKTSILPEFQAVYLFDGKYMVHRDDWTQENIEKLEGVKYHSMGEDYYLEKDEFEKLGSAEKIFIKRIDIISIERR